MTCPLFPNYRWLLLLVVALCPALAPAQAQSIQNHPVQTTAFLAAPTSQRLADYFSSDKRLIVDLLLKDLTKPPTPVYLAWSLEGAGIRISSWPGFLPHQFISLLPGIPTRLRGADLQATYFTPEAIETQGIPVGSIYTLELPEGFYTLTVQAFEAATGQQVSNLAQTYLVLAYPQPPILNLPSLGSEVPVTSLQKVPMAWSPRHFASPTTNVVYTLKVCEVPEGFEPTEQVLLSCTEPRLEVTSPATSYFPDLTQWIKPLEVGHRYATQVTVSDLSGELANFVNQGRSQVSWFRYGQECVPPVFTINPLGSDRLQLSWERLEGAQGYVVEYKLATATDWQVISSTGTTQVITGLSPTADYLFRMRTDCGGSEPSAASEIQVWNIRDQAPDVSPVLPLALTNPASIGVVGGGSGQSQGPLSLSALYANFPRAGLPQPVGTASPDSTLARLKLPLCAVSASSFAGCEVPHPTVGLPTGSRELTSLSVGDVLGIYDYAVFVTKVNTTGSPLSGEGLARLPFLKGTLVLVEFSGVSAKAGEAGTNGGCVYAVAPEGTSMPGYFRIKRASQAEVLAAQQGLISQVLQGQDSTASVFVGSLGQALARYDSVVTASQSTGPASQTLNAATKQALLPYVSAIEQGSQVLKSKLEGVYGGSSDPLVGGIRDSLGVLLGQVQTTLSSLQSSPATMASLPLLAARYQALFEQLARLTMPVQPPTSLTSTYGIRNVTLSQVSTTSANISWQGDPSFTRYVVTYQVQNGSPMSQTVSSPQLGLTNLQAGTNYTFSIQAYRGTEALSRYGPAIFATLARVLPPPEHLAYTVQDSNRVLISWDKNSQHLRYKLTYKGEDGIERFVYPTTNQATLMGLDLSQHYTYDIVAYGDQNLESARVASQISTCQLILVVDAKESTKFNEPAKVNEKITLRSGGCTSGTLLWQDINGNLLGTGNNLVIRPIETVSIKTVCTGTSCESQVLTISVAIATPSPLVCEDFVASAYPPVINKGESNTVTLTASGCTNGTVSWNGPNLAPNTPGQGQAQSVTVSNLSEAATYTAQCKKVGFDPVPAQVDVKAELRFTVTANPPAVKKGGSTTLKVDGCIGGTLTWTNLPSGCSVAPCSTSVKITDPPIIFEAICTNGSDQKSATARVDLITPNGSTVTNSACAGFVASVSPNGTQFFDPSTTFSLRASGCPGTISWSAQSKYGFTRTVAQSDKPGISTTYYVTCRDGNGTPCAQQAFPVNVHESSCPDFTVSVTPISKPTSAQVGGSNSVTPGVWTGTVATATGKYYAIQTNGCKSKDYPGRETITAKITIAGFESADLASNTQLILVDETTTIEIGCVANPDPPYDTEVCKKIINFSNVDNPQVNNARIAAPTGTAPGDSTQATGAARQGDLSGCSGRVAMAGVMAGYFQTFICDNISLLLDSNGNPSADKVNTLLQTLPDLVKNSPSLNYGAGVDFSAISADQLLAALKSPNRCVAAGELLGSAFKNQSSAYEYSAGIIPGYASINHALKSQLSGCSGPNQAVTSNYQGDDRSVTVQFNASSKPSTFNFLSGVKATYTNNRLTVSAVPTGFEKWRGDYMAYFDDKNHDVFLGFYKVGYKQADSCTISYTVSTTQVRANTVQQVVQFKDLIVSGLPNLLSNFVAGFTGANYPVQLLGWLARLGCSDAYSQIYNGQSPTAPLVQGSLRCCQYQQGRVAFDVLTLFYGPGEVKLAQAATQMAARISSFASVFSRLRLPASLLLRPFKKAVTPLLAITLSALPMAEAKALVSVGPSVTRVLAGAETVPLAADLAKAASLQKGPIVAKGVLGEVDMLGLNGGRLSGGGSVRVAQEVAGDATLLSEQAGNGQLRPLLLIYATGRVVQLAEEAACDICKQRTVTDNTLCVPLKDVISKSTDNAGTSTAVENFCKQPITDLSNANLKAIAQELTKDLDGDAIATFSKDVNSCSNNSYVLCQNLNNFRANQVAGWSVMNEGMSAPNSYLRKDYNCILYATDAVAYKQDSRATLVKALQTSRQDRELYLEELAGIANASGDDAPEVTKYNLSQSAAFDFVLNSTGCLVAQAQLGTASSIDQSGALASYTSRRQSAQSVYRANPGKSTMQAIIAASEAAGEAASDAYFLAHGYESLPCDLPGNGKQGQFDRVYGKRNGSGQVIELVVVECKGGSSQLGCRSGNQQGSTEYLISIVQNMVAKTPISNSSLLETTKLLSDNIRQDRSSKLPLSYYLINQPFDESGNLQPTIITPFILDNSKIGR